MPPATPAGLSFGDLSRCEEILKPPFRKALGSARVDLLPPPGLQDPNYKVLSEALGKGRAVFDSGNRRLLIPLLDGARPLGLLAVNGVSAEQLPSQVHSFLAALVETALDLVRSRLAAETDGLTGLGNEAALDAALTTEVARLSAAPAQGRLTLDDQDSGGLTLLAFAPRGLASWQERHGRRFSDQVLKALAALAQGTAPEPTPLARVGEVFYLLLPGGEEQARAVAGELSSQAAELRPEGNGGPAWPVSLSLGAARMDHRGNRPSTETGALLKLRAQRARQAGERAGLDELLFFHEIAARAGRVQEVMPLDRVLINLGRAHGLTEGERFAVCDPGQEPEQAKAQVAVSKLGSEESLAEVVELSAPASLLRPGDVLHRLAPQEAPSEEPGRRQTLELGGGEVAVTLEQASGALERRSLMAAYSALCNTGQPLAVAVLGVEGLEGMAEVVGRVGAEALMAALASAARQSFGPEAVVGRYSPEALAILAPDMDPAQALEAAGQALEAMRSQGGRPVRAGVTAHPREGFEAGEVMDHAAKALVHAGYLEPYSAVACDAVSLNVSGDALYNAGHWSEAVAEYEKALILQADEPNVLNSLGVCHGRLGNMERAAEYFGRAVEVSPEDFMAHYNLGLALLNLERVEEAGPCLARSLELEPKHADTLFQLGALAQQQGHTNQALDYYRRAASRPDCRPAVHCRLGQMLAAAGESAPAEAAFKEAVKHNPRDTAALGGLAVLYLDREANSEIALSLARRAQQQEPDQPRHVGVVARAMLALGQAQEASELLEDAVDRWPDNERLEELLDLAHEAEDALD
ncbi:MAG: tetratricopeptide repeat protein [Desulfarculaceae bacterium]|nr:tetratricopeptide repeat protein [Desulfarculaceae bacterium]MCF8073995.1 tetratricopeptide repeat protein [Desulfarculaceae bacterium]MCF8102681.1 tetratricopeptide repeat protein [Desulfarculaceae bacterium]MCF8116078.1 tetratricopeptide repeat protein [Desulfarculaceae bacterium]